MHTDRRSYDTSSQDGSLPEEKEQLISSSPPWPLYETRGWFYSRTHILLLYALNLVLLVAVAVLAARLSHQPFLDPTLGVYSPANEAVEWIKEIKFTSALFSRTPYMGFPTDETDQLWLDLYDSVAISKITKEEAELLPHPTLAIPGTDDYLVQLDVFHQLHCVDDLRKLLWPERYPGLEELKDENGVIDREQHAFLHWDHCIDALRQTIMCHADISPISWRVNMPGNHMIIPQLSTTHTCRNFTKVREWAEAHSAGEWNYRVPDDMLDDVVRTAGFDQAPDEDIQHLYKLFPGDTFFKYWRDHPAEAEAARKAPAEKGGES
ncbi:hypothetical protein C8A03DRAFT_30900 [Achaetomium macrosporum]|uniref:Uncharacterized protein n=1 Tax=Achaetomium macrosporum TaxID=79813 RepID=A0AAN7HEI6_9PEZI|nr:hypothetical protein C8A03DRAFT_30900 [Achaetomium macrosporum]